MGSKQQQGFKRNRESSENRTRNLQRRTKVAIYERITTGYICFNKSIEKESKNEKHGNF